MILKTLTLHNYRKYKHAVIDFPDGITAIVGLNGTGKSTLFEAIAWALYGSDASRTSTDQIKREGAEPKDSCRVELEFIFEEHTYRVTREMAGKSLTPSATILIDGALAATGAEVVTRFIEKRLSMDHRSFFTSIFAKQKELNVLSMINPSERRLLILRMLGIDTLDHVIREIRADAKNKNTLIDKLQMDLVDEKGDDRAEKIEKEIEELKLKYKSIDESLQRKKDELKIIKDKINKTEKDSIEQRKNYEETQHIFKKLSEKKSIYERKKKLEEGVTNLKTRIAKRKDDIKTHENKLKDLNITDTDKKEVEKRLQEIDEKKEGFIKIIESKRTIIDRLKKEIEEVESRKKNINKMGADAECPTCERILGEQYNILLKKFDKEIEERHKNIKNMEDELKKINVEQGKITNEYKALQKKKDYIDTLLHERKHILTVTQHLKKEIEREEKEKEEMEKELEAIKIVSFDILEYNRIKEQVDLCYSKYQRMLKTLDDIKKDHNKKEIEIERGEGEKKLISQELKNLESKKKELEDKRLRIKDEKTSLKYLNVLNDVMLQFRDHLISRIQPTLSVYASDYFERLTDGKYQEILIDDSYNIRIVDDGNPYSIERFSGGEEDLANLCLRLAISEIITERAGGAFNFVILDEIFGSQDNIRRQNIIKALHGLSSKFRQIFLVTHIDDVKNYTDNTITVTEDEEGVSTVKV
ncbi:MAG: SMC family ATPase, partial [Candidatus Thermoplasmatota archaeon]